MLYEHGECHLPGYLDTLWNACYLNSSERARVVEWSTKHLVFKTSLSRNKLKTIHIYGDI